MHTSLWTPLRVRPSTGVAKAVVAAVVTAAAVLALLAPLARQAHALGAGLTGPLTVSGNQILDNGKPTYLRGINRDGLEQNGSLGAWPDNRTTSPYDVVDIQKIRSYNINVVRVPLGSQYWLPNQAPCAEHDPAYVNAVDDMVSWITSQHMLALLDLHTEVPPGTILCPQNGAQLRDPAPDRNALAFWQQVASRYKNNPLVAFELFNEPHGISNSMWLNGGWPVTGFGVVYASTGMQQLYDTVRGTGAQNLVFIDGNGYAGDPSPVEIDPVRGTDIVYAQHVYTCGQPSAVGCSTDPSPNVSLWAPVRAHYPIVITEFGWPDVTNATFNQNVVNDVESVPPPGQYAGWLGFDWGGPRPNAGFNPFGIFTGWSYSGCPSSCRETDVYPTNPPGAAVPLINGWARNS